MSMKRKWFMHFLRMSIVQRKGRVLVAAASVMIAVGILISALGTSLGIREKLGAELKAYGANVIVSPTSGYINQSEAVEALGGIKGISGFEGQLYGSVGLRGSRVEMIGMSMQGAGTWKLEGALPSISADEILIGATLRDALGVKVGESLELDFGSGKVKMKLAGVVERGGPEDRAIILPIQSAWRLTGLDGRLSALLVRASTDAMEASVREIEARMKGVAVKTLRQVAYAEEAFLRKIELLMALVCVVVLIASSIGISSTMSATVLERIREIGLMKAIGATRSQVGTFFVAEGLVIGLIGGAAGYLIGLGAAEAVSKGAFGSFVSVPMYLLIVSLLVGAAISVGASVLPLLDALRYKPSVILRGE